MQSRSFTPMAGDLAERPAAMTQVIAVASGKGGVGKTNVVANVAMALSKSGQRVLVLDADLGLGNLDVLLGLVPEHTIEHVLAGTHTLDDVIVDGPGGIRVLPASSGVPQLTALNDTQQMLLLEQLETRSEEHTSELQSH